MYKSRRKGIAKSKGVLYFSIYPKIIFLEIEIEIEIESFFRMHDMGLTLNIVVFLTYSKPNASSRPI